MKKYCKLICLSSFQTSKKTIAWYILYWVLRIIIFLKVSNLSCFMFTEHMIIFQKKVSKWVCIDIDFFFKLHYLTNYIKKINNNKRKTKIIYVKFSSKQFTLPVHMTTHYRKDDKIQIKKKITSSWVNRK